MLKLKACPLCRSKNITSFPQIGIAPFVQHEIMPGVKVEAGIISRYSVCNDCHIIFQNPRLSDRELDKYYSQGYYRKQLNDTDKKIDESELSRAKTDAKIIKRYLDKPFSHLDIGCGRGYLLDIVNAESKVGVEPETGFVKAKDVNVNTEINKVPHKIFDLVTAIHVLEHVSKPLEYLQIMTNFVDKSGYLVVEVPTWKSKGGPLRLAHLYHFESDVLRLMCRQAGFKVVDTEFTPHLMLICKRAN